jgi:hypothetical protein
MKEMQQHPMMSNMVNMEEKQKEKIKHQPKF